MANPSSVDVTPGSGVDVATHLVSESGVDKHIQRMNPNTPEGEDASIGSFIQIDVTVTRPANVTPYAINDAWSDHVSSPVAGGFLFANASRGDGKSGLITDLVCLGSLSPATLLEAELWLFSSTITNVNDNAAFGLSITDLRKLVATIPFTMAQAASGVSKAEVEGLNRGFTTTGSPNLYGLIKVKNAYTPGSAEALTFRLKCMRVN
jgi:hypothetical protein